MATVKFIVPATYDSHNGHQKDAKGNASGEKLIEQVPYENAGEVVEVPEADAADFDKKGWARAEEGAEASTPKRGKK